MKFDLGVDTLTSLSAQTSGAHDDLGSLIRRLVDAAAPLEGRFNGAGRAAFDAFKAHSDEVAAELNSALAAILGGQRGMDRSFATGDADMTDNARSAQSGASFDAARFAAQG